MRCISFCYGSGFYRSEHKFMICIRTGAQPANACKAIFFFMDCSCSDMPIVISVIQFYHRIRYGIAIAIKQGSRYINSLTGSIIIYK